ncbi:MULTISPECIES: TetR/AcrR family transcriptional regulator [Niveibacterium]|uniref:TetR/AcrR family transcriptional regulator n=1 Tax=Niveibacterium microcysteis TaxID=2811415 RepID=A0ABX7LZX6_9RHOO|nr:TetR/AcrR family transcriptional regulator [Niveibacterium microcysteis]QSI75066.1 TetR/AcrR family transcriptional regulator [Niveibacterium microcysteis]
MEKTPPKSRASAATRPPLDRKAWIQAATDALAEEGLAGLRVEVLAKRCGVTKGSFYWHFRDRQELLDEVLNLWKEGRIRDVSKQARGEPGKPLEQLVRVIDVYSSSRNRRGIQIELAVRDWARRDPKAAKAVEEVDQWRLKLGKDLFIASGMEAREAASRSLLLYAYSFGLSLMIYEHFDGDVGALRAQIADFIARGATPA